MPYVAAAAGIGDRRPEGPQFSDVGLLTQAAAAGQGVALGQSVIVADDLAARAADRALQAPHSERSGVLPRRAPGGVAEPGSGGVPSLATAAGRAGTALSVAPRPQAAGALDR